MKKILFLDIDGVLNDNKSNNLSWECVDLVKKIIAENMAKVVIISSLQNPGTKVKRDKLTNSLNRVGIEVADFIDPNFEGKINEVSLAARTIGIIDYLKRNNDCQYVILDDDYFEEYQMLDLNCCKTHMWKGIQKEDMQNISFKKVDLERINSVKYQYRELGPYEIATINLIKVLKKVIVSKDRSN